MKRFVMVAAVLAALALPAAALASGGSTCQSYNPQLCTVANVVTSQTTASTSPSGASTTSTASAGTLPFTGLDVGFLVVGGGVLLGAGLLVRRLSRDPR